MQRMFLVAFLLVAACHHEGEENLGIGASAQHVDVAKLTQPHELYNALGFGGPDLDRALGPHRMQASSSLKLELPEHQTPESLDETFDVAWDGKALRLRHENEQDYGFEAISDGNRLWVKPRYGRYVLRRPEGDDLERLRKTAELPAASWLRVFLPSLQVTEMGRAQVAGHDGVKLALSARATPSGKVDVGNDPQKAWRRTVQVKYLSGDVIVDARTGAPLSVHIDAGFSFERDGKPIAATLAFKQMTTVDPGLVELPVDYVTLSRPRPMLDRQQLLEGLARLK